MNRCTQGIVWLPAVLILSTLGALPAAAQSTGAPPQYMVSENSGASTDDWPRQVSANGSTVTVYQPQFDSLQADVLTGRAAVSITTAASAVPVYGVVWFSAHAQIDKAAGLVTLDNIQVTKANLPPAPAVGPDYAQIVTQNLPGVAQSLSLARVEALLSVSAAERQQKSPQLDNAPPHMFVSQTPSVLVLIDGQPVIRPVTGTNLLRVTNTRALIAVDQDAGTYYLYVVDRWMQAPALQGPWTPAGRLQAGLDVVKKDAVSDESADLLDNPTPEVKDALDHNQPVAIFVSTEPAALIETEGSPDLQPIAGTNLLWAQNCHASLFMDVDDQYYYTLSSGRWYRSRMLNDGAWSYVDGADLPKDFASIPESHPAGDALPSVPGTPEAAQARIAAHVPQTATVQRDAAQLTVFYDGDPQFSQIEGTGMQYAVNTATPVVLMPDGSYFACSNGVWFQAGSANGPWTIALSVPSEIYTIPPTCPINYVTNVYVYGYDDNVVYVGYTPGYLGTYIAPDGCVVYGSGYTYPSWTGHVWYGAPITYGVGVAFDFTSAYGWSFGFGWGWGPTWRPWWGPWAGYWRDHGGDQHAGPWTWHDANFNRYNVYHRWDSQVVASRRRLPSAPGGHTGTPARRPANNVFAGADGYTYRKVGSAWQRFDGSAWRSVGGSPAVSPGRPRNIPRPGEAAGATPTVGQALDGVARGGPAPLADLNRDQQARALAQARANAARQAANPPQTAPVVRQPAVARPPVQPTLRLPNMGGTFGGYARRPAAPSGGGRTGGGGGAGRSGGGGARHK